MNSTLEDLRDRLRRFADARDWERFHTPKNLSMALTAEAAELAAHFQWLGEGQSVAAAAMQEIEHELADVLIYLVRLADRLDVDLLDAVERKVRINAQRFPPTRDPGP